MRFLVDRCAGQFVVRWLRAEGHDVRDIREEGPDPGDLEVLRAAAADGRILVTLDKDFGRLLFSDGERHRGVVRLPDVPAAQRIELLEELIVHHSRALVEGAVITIRGGRIRVSRRV